MYVCVRVLEKMKFCVHEKSQECAKKGRERKEKEAGRENATRETVHKQIK